MTVDRPEVAEAERLEEVARRRVPRSGRVVQVPGRARSRRGRRPRGRRGEPRHRRRVGAPVVVQDDDDVRAGGPDVVQRLVGDATGQGAVADDGDHASRVSPEPAGHRQPVGVGERRRGVAVLDEVVGGLGAVGVAGEAAALAQPGELLLAAGDQLVHVGLVAGVPHDGVVGRREHAVQCERELDDAEVRAQVAPGLGDTRDEEPADLRRKRLQLHRVHRPKPLGRRRQCEHRLGADLDDAHVSGCSRARGATGGASPCSR